MKSEFKVKCSRRPALGTRMPTHGVERALGAWGGGVNTGKVAIVSDSSISSLCREAETLRFERFGFAQGRLAEGA